MRNGDEQQNYRAGKSEHLLDCQQRQLGEIVSRMLRMSGDACDHASDPRDDVRRPHNVFCLDGARGAGKTYALMTLEHVLRVTSQVELDEKDENGRSVWHGVIDAKQAQEARVKAASDDRGFLIYPLRLIFPGDLERPEFVMETIFAAIRRDIDRDSDKLSGPRLDEYKRLSKSLSDEIAAGWHFAHRLGFEALIRDSLDFDALVRKYDRLNTRAADRIAAWRRFLDDYLKYRGAAMLAILLDDSDVRPEATFDILRSIRTFLNHPRLLTVLAANIRSMRESLIHLGMNAIGPSMSALNAPRHPTGAEWRRSVRVSVEDYLEKVLPDSRRFYLQRPNYTHDFKRITESTIRDICDRVINSRRKSFVDTKFQLALRQEVDRGDLPDGVQRKALEEYLSWWNFRAKYLPMLSPRTARQIESFGQYFSSRNGENDRPSKRLLVTLFNNPANYSLIQRFADEDNNAVAWMMQQAIGSNWIGPRNFVLNKRALAEGSYSYDYIRYRVDLGLALPLADNAEAILPPGLLPTVAGRQRMRRFFKPSTMHRREKTLGAARMLDHAAIPGNCLYLYDLSGLPDIAFAHDTSENGPNAGGNWEAGMWAAWPGFLDDQDDDSRGLAGSGAGAAALNTEGALERYFVDIVCQRLRHTEAVRTSELIAALNTPDVQDERSHVAYTTFLWDEISSFPSGAIATSSWRAAGVSLKAAEPYTSLGEPVTGDYRGERAADTAHQRIALARYAALFTDLRRAWHAIRIHESGVRARQLSDDPDLYGTAGRSLLGMIDNRSRLKLYTHESLLKVLEKDPWLAVMLKVFAVGDEERAQRLEKLSAAVVGLVAPDATQTEAFEAPDDERLAFEKTWAAPLRLVGRALCEGWPSWSETGHGKGEKRFFENARLHQYRAARLVLSRDNDELLEAFDWEDSDEAKLKLSENARSARAFVWLMYGLAPSLSAMVHADIAGRLNVLVQKRPASGKAAELKTWLRQLDEINAALGAWRRTTVTLALVLKYVKMKTLHLYAALAISTLYDHALGQKAGTSASPDKVAPHALNAVDIEALTTAFYEALARGESGVRPSDKRAMADAVKAVRQHLAERPGAMRFPALEDDQAILWGFLAEKFCGLEPGPGGKRPKRPRDDLSIMPDASPSTLFGDHWMTDIVARLRRDDAGPVTTSGVFGETEHWLWAVHLMIRRLEATIGQLKESRRPVPWAVHVPGKDGTVGAGDGGARD